MCSTADIDDVIMYGFRMSRLEQVVMLNCLLKKNPLCSYRSEFEQTKLSTHLAKLHLSPKKETVIFIYDSVINDDGNNYIDDTLFGCLHSRLHFPSAKLTKRNKQELMSD